MTIAAQEACILRDMLSKRAGARDPFAGLGQAFLAQIQPLIADAWLQSAVADFAHPRTRGEPPADLENSLRFGRGLLRLAGGDPAVHETMIGVRQLIKPRSALGHPELVGRVSSLQGKREGRSPSKSHFSCGAGGYPQISGDHDDT
jgi:hypothetical protein